MLHYPEGESHASQSDVTVEQALHIPSRYSLEAQVGLTHAELLVLGTNPPLQEVQNEPLVQALQFGIKFAQESHERVFLGNSPVGHVAEQP